MREGFFLKRRDVQPRTGQGRVDEVGVVISEILLWSLLFIILFLFMVFLLIVARVTEFIILNLAEEIVLGI